MTPSPEQQSIYDLFLSEPHTSQLIVSSAGSGKTTTGTHLAHLCPAWTVNKFLAFNKNIAMELLPRLPANCPASTFHSAGNSALAATLRGKRPRIDGGKLRFLARSVLKSKQLLETYATPCVRLVGYAKNAGIGLGDFVSWEHLISHFSVLHDGTDSELIRFSQQLLAASNAELGHIDFDDMLYLPLLLNAPFQRTPNVFVDEAQDTNTIQRLMLGRMLAPGGRLIAVGDPSQAIYGFRGASTDAMNDLRRDFNMTVMPLSVSYRCSQAVVKEAQPYDKGLTI